MESAIFLINCITPLRSNEETGRKEKEISRARKKESSMIFPVARSLGLIIINPLLILDDTRPKILMTIFKSSNEFAILFSKFNRLWAQNKSIARKNGTKDLFATPC